MKSVPLLALLILLLAAPALAATHIDEEGEADREERIEREFRLGSAGKLTLTVAARAGQSGHLRVYFYERSPQGGWREIDALRVVLRDSARPESADFELPEGHYKVVISARRMRYAVKLEDAAED